jgi:hypothetical protein
MRKTVSVLALAAVMTALSTAPAMAQLHDNVVFPAMPGVGVTVAGDVALGLNDDAKISGESPKFVGGRVILGLPMFSVWAGAGTAPLGIDGVDSELGFGGGAGFHVFNAPLMPVKASVQAGVGYLSETGGNLLNVTGGVLVVINVPSAAIGVEPWVMPRVQLVRASFGGLSDSEFGFGASGGINVTLPMGVGAHVAIDWLTIGDPSVSPLHAAAGLHYKINVPSLGM